MTPFDQTDLAYFVMALQESADQYDSSILRALAKDARKLKRHVKALDEEIAQLYGFLDELTNLTPLDPHLGKDAANFALADLGRRIRAYLGTEVAR
jgi:hypothetical protein